MSNAAFYFIAAMVLLRHAVGREVPAALWILAVPVVVLAGVYAWLLRRGPVERNLQVYRARS